MGAPRRLRRGIYLLPTLFTIGNMFCGYSSIVQSTMGNFEIAAMCIILAAVLDGLDGRIARLTGTQSDFGLEFDSLADIVSFGLAPALLVHQWALQPTRLAGSLAFLYVVCAAMRLARFNLAKAVSDKRNFAGLPSPMAGIALAAIVFAFPEPTHSRGLAALYAAVVFALAVAMISRLRYRSFRELDLRNRRSYVHALPIAAVLIAVALSPKAMLLLIGVAYVGSGPALYLWSLAHRKTSAAALAGERGPAAGSVIDEQPLR